MKLMVFKKYLIKIKRKIYRLINFALVKKPKGFITIDLISAKRKLKNFDNVTINTYTEEYEQDNIFCKNLPGDSWSSMSPFNASTFIIFLEISNSSFRFSNNYLIAPDNNAIYQDGFPFKGTLFSKYSLSWRIKKFKGTIAFLSNSWVENYYHWLAFTLPLLRIYNNFIPLDSINYFYVGEVQLSNFQVETLKMIGIGRERIITTACKGDKLLTAFSLTKKQNTGIFYRSFHDYSFTRKVILPYIQSQLYSPKKIYVARGDVNKRKVINEKEVIKYLSSIGFVSVSMDGKKVIEQAAIFFNAEAIVAPHGAALANLMFSREGTIVIELFSEQNCEISHFSTACFIKANYYYMKCKQLQNSNIEVDLEKLNAICQMAKVA